MNGTVGKAGVTCGVKPICRRTGTTGSGTPASSPSRADQAPAAQTTASVRMVPRSVSTALMAPPVGLDAGDRRALVDLAAERLERRAYAATTWAGSA